MTAFLNSSFFLLPLLSGHLSLDRPEQFPQGLGGIFCQWFQRQFPDLEKFRQDVCPALRITASRKSRRVMPSTIKNERVLYVEMKNRYSLTIRA